MTRVIGPPKSRRRRWTFLWCLAVAVAAGVIFIPGALAVHDLDFQLDGDTTNTAYSPPANHTPAYDWNDIFNADGTNTALVNPLGGNGSFTNADFDRDFLSGPSCNDTSTVGPFCTGDSTTFATGSKDTLDISGWQCNKDNNVNSKIDIMNAYSTAYTAANGDKILYFGLEKNSNNGTNDVGFWFLQGNADCDAANGTQTWSGLHTVGDILVVSEFTSGGGVSTVAVYKWVGTTDPAGPLVPFGSGGDCKTQGTGPNDVVCATTNSGAFDFKDSITTKWPTADKRLGVGNTIPPPDFFEGGINLTLAFQQGSGTAPPACFNTFIGDTRSSVSKTATLFDYARGTLGECSVTMTTTPSTTSTTLLATTEVKDTANLVGHTTTGGTAPSPGGTVNFFLCSPSQLDANLTCSTGGTAVTGNPVQVIKGTAPNSSAVSGNVRSLITVVGKYCFRAEYSAGATEPNYPGATAGTDNLAAECFTVSGTSTLSTAQNWIPNDTATIGGDSAFSGNLTFTLYPSTDCTGTSVYSEGPTAVSGPASGATFHTNNPGGTSTGGFTVAKTAVPANHVGAPGDYSWLVHYADTSGLTSPTDKCEVANVSITD
jgi:hypothetical protein